MLLEKRKRLSSTRIRKTQNLPSRSWIRYCLRYTGSCIEQLSTILLRTSVELNNYYIPTTFEPWRNNSTVETFYETDGRKFYRNKILWKAHDEEYNCTWKTKSVVSVATCPIKWYNFCFCIPYFRNILNNREFDYCVSLAYDCHAATFTCVCHFQ